jgi:hypothetical protein
MEKPEPLAPAIVAGLIAVGAVAVVLSLGALVFVGWGPSLGVAIGGLVAVSNLWVLAHIGRGVLSGGPRRRMWALAGAAKFLALVAGAWFLLQTGLVSGLALAAGYASLPVGLTLASFWSASDPPIERKRLAPRKRSW